MTVRIVTGIWSALFRENNDAGVGTLNEDVRRNSRAHCHFVKKMCFPAALFIVLMRARGLG